MVKCSPTNHISFSIQNTLVLENEIRSSLEFHVLGQRGEAAEMEVQGGFENP